MRHWSVIVLAYTFALSITDSAHAQNTSWLGKNVFAKKSDATIGHTDAKGNQVALATLDELTYKVRGENGNWIAVVTAHGVEGWLKKADAVPLEEAVSHFTNQIKQRPGDALAYGKRGAAFQLSGKLDSAVKDFDDMVRLRPTPVAYNGRGTVFSERKEFDKAIADFNEAIRLDPKYADAYTNRGNAWRDKKEYENAFTDFNEAIRIDPKCARAYYSRGLFWSEKKDYDKEIADYAEAMRIDPKLVSAYNARGAAWSDKKEFDKALADFDAAARIDPRSIYAYNAQAWLWATCADSKVRNGPKAVESAKKALELNSKSGDTMDTLAAAYAEAGDFEHAVEWEERALRDPTFADDSGFRERLELYRAKKAYHEK